MLLKNLGTFSRPGNFEKIMFLTKVLESGGIS